jgi:hypothetical protein
MNFASGCPSAIGFSTLPITCAPILRFNFNVRQVLGQWPGRWRCVAIAAGLDHVTRGLRKG